MQFRDPRTPLTADQLKLRQDVLRQITEHPRSLYMGTWAQDHWHPESQKEMNVCETTRCIGGWAAELSPHITLTEALGSDRGISIIAGELLGLTEREFYGDPAEIVAPLFYADEDVATERLREITERPHYEPR